MLTPVAVLNFLLLGVAVLLALLTASRLRGSTMFWAAAVFVFTGLTAVAHAGAEVVGFGAATSAVSSYVAAILLFFAVVVLDISTRLFGVK
jgi:hypothetical protein